MPGKYLGRIPFSHALEVQNTALEEIRTLGASGIVIGFESDPVITLGLRATPHTDVTALPERLNEKGFQICPVDRGGHATIHNPGQLVIFPVWKMRHFGARAWIEGLAKVTSETLAEWGIEARWDACRPGLYTARGKIMACGVRVRQGVSTHGIALNVCNDLGDFSLIRACGIENAPIDRMGGGLEPMQVFSRWVEKFKRVYC